MRFAPAIGLACAAFVMAGVGPAAADKITKCLDPKGKVLYTQGACPAGMRRAGEVAPPPPPGTDVPRPDWSKTFETKNGADKEPAAEDRKEKSAAKKHDRACGELADKLAKLQDKRAQQGRQGYTQKQRDALDEDIREIEAKMTREACR